MNLSKQTKTDKISIVGYTEYKANYKNNNAYKFLNNFTTKKEVSPNKNNGGDTTPKFDSSSQLIKKSQGKIISDLVNEVASDKKININININTHENANEGLITTSRYYHQKMNQEGLGKISMNGLDYIVLGEEEYNKDFDITDVDKLIMSESKGTLIGMNNEEDELENSQLDISLRKRSSSISSNGYKEFMKAIKYQISTYKGQSGSPIFMRIKRMTEKKHKE